MFCFVLFCFVLIKLDLFCSFLTCFLLFSILNTSLLNKNEDFVSLFSIPLTFFFLEFVNPFFNHSFTFLLFLFYSILFDSYLCFPCLSVNLWLDVKKDKKVAKERILSELEKMLHEEHSLRAVVLMYYLNILPLLFVVPHTDEMYCPLPGWNDPNINFKYVINLLVKEKVYDGFIH